MLQPLNLLRYQNLVHTCFRFNRVRFSPTYKTREFSTVYL